MESPNTPDFAEGFPVDRLRDGAMIQGRVGAEDVVLALHVAKAAIGTPATNYGDLTRTTPIQLWRRISNAI